MKKSKLIFVHLYNDRSGSPKVLAQVISALHLAGFSGELLTSGHTDGFLTSVPIIKRKLFFKRSNNKWLTLLWYALGQILLFIQCLRYWRQDVIFYINTMMPAGAALAAWLMGKRVIYHVHETSISPAVFKRCLRGVIQLTASKVVFVSNFLLQQESFKYKEQFLLYNAIALPELKLVDKKTFNVLMVCSLKEYKGVNEFVQLANMLVLEYLMSFTLVLNADLDEIKEYFTDELPHNLTLISRQQNVTPFYEQASVVINLSRTDECMETFGLTVLEAMSYGLPVIVPPVGGPAELVRDQQEGFLLAGTQLAVIAERLLEWQQNPLYYADFSQRALARAGDFDIVKFNHRIEHILMPE